MVIASWSMRGSRACLRLMSGLNEPEGRVREAAQRGGLRPHRSTAQLGEHSCCRRTDGDGGGGLEQPVEILFTQRALELDDGGGPRERHRADLAAADPVAALVEIEC